MAGSNSDDVAALKAERSDVIALLRIWTQRFRDAGMPEDFTLGIDGESYSFSTWRKEKLQEIRDLTQTIRELSAPWMVRSRGTG